VKEKIDTFLKYNIARIRKAEQFDHEKADFFFKIVPLLLHINHSELPGYISSDACPCGIFGFSPTKTLSPQTYHALFALAPPLDELNGYSFSPPAVQSLKTIGSTGTIAQSNKSDCDFWVSIHAEKLGKQGVNLLQEKCLAIEKWALNRGIEIHFFLMDIDQTKENSFESLAEEESAGSSLKLLLKDELFRTHILVAGKALLWWLIPPGLDEEHYRSYSERLLGGGLINTDQFIDLGYISDIPKAEIFGACLWQMNKALDSPFKSVIKFAYLELLLSRQQKSLPLFSDRIKCLITYPEKLTEDQKFEFNIEDVDPYLLLARDIITYYKNIKTDPEQGELICKCLFLKTLEGMEIHKQKNDPDKTKDMQHLMEKCQLLPIDYARLLKIREWRHRQLANLGNAVHKYLIDTYKRLRKVFRKFQNPERLTITERDIAVLGRKLFTFYEKKPDKIEFLRSISRDSMKLDDITIHITRGSGHNLYLAFQGKHDHHTVQKQAEMVIRREKGIIPLLVWLWVNGILHPETTLHLTKNFLSLSQPDLQDLVMTMNNTLPRVDFARISGQQLLQPERITTALVIVNLEKHQVKNSKNLYSSVVTSNSYGEFFVHDLNTAAQLKKTLAQLLARHYVSRWNKNLHFFVPPQPEQSRINSILGI
jgi:adenylate cyclase class 1